MGQVSSDVLAYEQGPSPVTTSYCPCMVVKLMPDYLDLIYRDWVNNYEYVGPFADAYGLTHQQAFDLITMCYDRHVASGWETEEEAN